MPLIDDRRRVCCASHHREPVEGFTTAGATDHYPPEMGLEPVHTDIDLHIDLEGRACEGTVTVTFKARRDGVCEVTLDAVAFEGVEVVDPEGRSVSFSYDGLKLRAVWLEAATRGEVRRLAITYKVVKPASGLFFSGPTEAYPQQAWYAATDHETERARHWLPCIDLPNARTKLDFHLRAQSRFTILANGAQVGEESHDDGTKTVHWRLDFPCPSYLVCMAIGDFTRCDDGEFEGLPVAYFASREHTEDDLRRAFGRTKDILAWMTGHLDMAFPFPKYYQFALPGFGGAMENISLVSWDDIFVLDAQLAKEWTWLVDQINVHEMAHSYFGDAVVCRDFAHAWLKESWATYMESCWLEHSKGQDEFRYNLFADAHSYFGEADGSYKRPIVTRTFNHSWDMYDMHLYPGGACRLHTLRKELGDDVFWGGVQAYLKQYKGKVVETDDFRRALEEHSGRSLVRFFEQWIYKPGYPSLKASFSYDAKKKKGTFEIEQTQVDAKTGVEAFELSLALGWTVDGQEHRQSIKLDKANHTFVIAMEEPQMVRVDPDGHVLHKLSFNPGDDKLRQQLTDAPDVVGRILAAQELAKTGRVANLEAVAEAYAKESFWGVRVKMAQALAKAETEASIGILAGFIKSEQDHMVLPTLMGLARKFRDVRIAHAVEGRIRAGVPPRSAMMGYEALGAQRSAAPVALLADAAAQEGFNGVAQSGALRGLAMTRQTEVLSTLMELSGYGATSNRARPAAATALGILGRSLDEHRRQPIIERLIDLLRDPVDRVQWAAARALKDLKAGSAVGALDAYKRQLSAQDAVSVTRWIAAIHKGQSPKVSALEKQLEDTRDLLRKLTARIDKLEANQD